MIKVLVFKASDDDYKEFVTFETLDDFFKFVDNEMSAKGTHLAAEYGAIKNYCIPKKDVERAF